MKKAFFLILLLAFILRYNGINWDEGHHLHPDERMIIMVVGRINLPKTNEDWQKILTPESSFNPKFFAYCSFPMYLLKGAGLLLNMDNYDSSLYLGRIISIVFDVGTTILVYLITKSVISNFKFLISNKIPNPNI